jgi:hypothetical protein
VRTQTLGNFTVLVETCLSLHGADILAPDASPFTRSGFRHTGMQQLSPQIKNSRLRYCIQQKNAAD